MQWYFIAIPLVLLYSLFTYIVYTMMMTNTLFWRSKEYTIPFGLGEGTQKKKHLDDPYIRYWRCDNPTQIDNKWVILFHSWGRNSARMIKQGEYYWDRGYSIILIDALSHGQSEWQNKTAALWFANHAMTISDIEGIVRPAVHGLSFGAIASVIYAANHSVRSVVAEALMNNIADMLRDFMRTLPFPTALFWWIPGYIRSRDFPWEEAETYLLLPKIKAPFFLIHGEKDIMFSVEEHFNPNKKLLNDMSRSWVVPNSAHSRMSNHPEYGQKLMEFIDYVDSIEIL